MRTSGLVIRNLKPLFSYLNQRHFIHIFALICLISIIWVELGMVHVRASSFDHTTSTVGAMQPIGSLMQNDLVCPWEQPHALAQ